MNEPYQNPKINFQFAQDQKSLDGTKVKENGSKIGEVIWMGQEAYSSLLRPLHLTNGPCSHSHGLFLDML